MPLCQPARCGCALDTRSIHITGNGQPATPYDLTPYYRVIDDDDALPAGADAWLGLEIYTTPFGPVCTTVLTEDFTSVTDWTGTITSVAGGRVGNMGRVTGTNTATYTIPTVDESPTVTVGVTYKVDTLAATRAFLQLASDSGATTHITLDVRTDGAIEARLGGTGGTILGATAAGLVTAATWYHIETRVTLDNTPSGTVTVRVDGTEQLDLVNIDTRNGGTKPGFDTVRLHGGGATSDYDDLRLAAGPGCTFQGDPHPLIIWAATAATIRIIGRSGTWNVEGDEDELVFGGAPLVFGGAPLVYEA